MPRRVSLPGAGELFGGAVAAKASPDRNGADGVAPGPPQRRGPSGRRTSGRVKHDTKITVYVTEAELLGLEHARLLLRAEHGLAADRGRIVREAIDVVLADFVERGSESVLVRRLQLSTEEAADAASAP